MTLRDHEAELGALFLAVQNPELADTFFEKLRREDFTHKDALTIFDFFAEQARIGESITQTKLFFHLREQGLDVDKLIPRKMPWLPGEFGTLVERLENLSARRRIMQAVGEIVQSAQDPEQDISRLQGFAQEEIFKATEDQAGARRDWQHISDVIGDFYVDFQARQEGETVERDGLKTGYPGIDGCIGGLKKGHLTTIAAYTSVGKSGFALNLAVNVARRDHTKKVGIFTLEMEAREFAERVIAMTGKIPVSQYHRKLSELELKNFNRTIDGLYDKNIYLQDERGLTVAQIKAKARRKAKEVGGFDLLVIDYLNEIRMENPTYNLPYEVGLQVNEIRNLAQELDCPILLLCQMSRGPAEEEGKAPPKPRKNRLRDSGRIEEASDELLLLWRDDSEEGELQEAEVNVAKARTGKTFRIPFTWYKDFLYWEDKKNIEKSGCLKYGRVERSYDHAN